MAVASTSNLAAVSTSTSSLASSPTLSKLVPHLLSARRSLSCVEYVSRANTLIRSTTQTIEYQISLAARGLYIRNGSRAQIGTLDKVTGYVDAINMEIKEEWENITRSVDGARERLERTVQILQQTRVEQKLKGSMTNNEEQDGEEEESHKNFLVDFVDETGFKVLLTNIDECQRLVSEVRERFDGNVRVLYQETEMFKSMLQSTVGRSDDRNAKVLDPPMKVLNSLQDMEQNAGEMAKNLESLVQHFDLCVTAIKHTEGGGAAASKLAKELPGGLDLDLGKDEPLEDLTEEEMQEIRIVIDKDAAEVDDVVAEIKTGLEEIEVMVEDITSYSNHLKQEFQFTTSIFHLLQKIGGTLPAHITQSQLFVYQWEEEKGKIAEYLVDLESIRDFYANFVEAYDNLLIEVGRRKDVEKRINKIRKGATVEINKLIDEEVEERRIFKMRQGDFLPVDIWPGLTLPPSRYEFVKIDDSGDSIPDISASVINRAIKRVSLNKGKHS